MRAGNPNREPLSPAAVSALASLGRGDAEALSGEEHLVLMGVLVEDLMEMERMRNWLQRRLVRGGMEGRGGGCRYHPKLNQTQCNRARGGWGGGGEGVAVYAENGVVKPQV